MILDAQDMTGAFLALVQGEYFGDFLTFMIHEHASTSISVPVSLPLQGYDESYTDTGYESYDSYYSQPQA